jgi:predicted nucleotidyltransferase/DNA-binding HxlR family transcriptional regulator
MKSLNNKGTNMLHMERKDYKLEIVQILLQGENHLREIARELKTNHMMVVRKIRELLGDNVVDFKQIGKNQVYFLKKNTESRSLILMSQQYFLLRFIKKNPSLRDVINKIQEDSQIKLALIFGSYAKGLNKKDSDLDIFIETSELEIKKKYSRLDSKFSIKIGKYDRDENLIKEIEKKNILIKGGEVYYEKVFN